MKNLPQSNFILYTGNDGQIDVKVFLQDETVWLTQKEMGQLFGKDRSVITKHLKNICACGELDEKSNVQKMHFPHSDKPINFYNLDVIISVGYRVNSYQATQFRILTKKSNELARKWKSIICKTHFPARQVGNKIKILQMTF